MEHCHMKTAGRSFILALAMVAAPQLVRAEMPRSPYCDVSAERRSEQHPTIQPVQLDEISGLVVSQTQPDVFWVHNDSGDGPSLYAVNPTDGQLIGTWQVAGADAVDWEDLAGADCDHQDSARGRCLFIADMGNNSKRRTDQVIYRVREPDASSADGTTRTTETADIFPISYILPPDEPDPNPDAESLAVHPITGKLYIVTKEADKGRILESDPPGAPGTPLVFRVIGEIPLILPDGADISPDGRHLVVRTYGRALEYLITDNDVAAAVAQPGTSITLEAEPQGEAIAYSLRSRYLEQELVLGEKPYDLYTISEKKNQPIWGYHYFCDGHTSLPDEPDMRDEDMGALDMSEPPDMVDAPDMGSMSDMGAADMGAASGGDKEDGCGCGAAGGGAAGNLVWALPLMFGAARRRRDKRGHL
jgi:MYXO-CTERM domain-containing protein